MSAWEEHDYTKQFDWKLWGRVMHYAMPYRKVLYRLAPTLVVVAGLDVAWPMLVRHLIDKNVTGHTTDGLGLSGLFITFIMILQGLAVYLLIYYAGKIEQGLVYDIRKEAFARLQRLSFTYYDRSPVGWLLARLTSDAMRLSEVLAWSLVDFIWGIALMIGVAITLLVMNWKLGLVTLAVVPPLVWGSLWFQKVILNSYRKVRKTNSKITGAFNEGINGARTTKTLGREQANLEEFSGLTGSMRRHSIQAAVRSAMYMPFVMVLGTLGSSLAIMAGGNGVIAGTLSYGTLIAFLVFADRFFEPITQMAYHFAELQGAQAAAERVFSLLHTPVDIDDTTQARQSFAAYFAGGENLLKPLSGDVEFKNVSFAYVEGKPVLTDFNLKVKPGEKIALVGETGAGKTTVVNLLGRFYEPGAGEILMDGQPHHSLPLQYLRSNIGTVLQTPYLFKGTVCENIRYGNLNATDAEVENAARLVNADAFIRQLEKGYDTPVGEGGALLSTGQKQMISFARAILANPAIFILDEATSAVDTETEFLIQKAVDTLLQGRTSFVVAHRLSTIRSADRILVMEHGRVVEEGSHRQLIKKQGRYYQLYTNQFYEEQEQKLLQA